MKRAHNLMVALLLVLGAAHLAFAEVKPIQMLPLSKVVSTGVGEVKDRGGVEVPIITWGGDIATIMANGNGPETVPGSIFAKDGLKIKLVKEDDFTRQVQAYLAGRSPFLRGTVDMISLVADLEKNDPRIAPVIVYQLTWSSGGDTLVVKENIKKPADLKGKTIAIQANGPHLNYLNTILRDAGLSIKDVKLLWTKDLTGTDQTPVAAFRQNNVDAAAVISPDASALTSGGTEGTGGESVKGARILLSTKTANRVIADVYAVRADYLEANRDKVMKFTAGLMKAEEALRDLTKNKTARADDYKKMISGAAKMLMDADAPQAISDTEGMYGDCEYVGWKGNVKFFTDRNNPRSFERVWNEVQSGLIDLGLMSKKVPLVGAEWDFNKLKAGLTDIAGVEAPKFDEAKVAQVVTQKQQMGTLEEGTLFSFEVFFQPNQKAFEPDLYEDAFKRAIDMAATYGGSLIVIEGHSDPLGYLKRLKAGASAPELNQIKQAAKNLSYARVNAVRDALIEYAKSKNITLDPSQFSTVGYGIMKPKTGMDGDTPRAPRNKNEWLANMRVEFRMIQVEAEMNKFELIK